jgi:hypothetical protein
MSRNSKPWTAVSITLILATAGAISVTAQTQAENPSTSTATTASSTITSTAREGKTVDTVRASVPFAPTTSPKTPVPQTADPDKWQFQFSPYFWLAGLHGIGGTENRTTAVDESFSDVFDALNFAFMATFEARKGRFISLTDLEYVSVSDEKATPGPLFSTVDAGFKTFIFDQEVGYRLFDDPEKGASIDVLGGVRVWHVSTDFEFGAGILPATRIDASRNWVDGVGGLRGKMALSQKMFLTGKFDLGGGGSNFTWQIFAGGGYNINPKIALILGYRVLDVNYNKNNFVYDMNQRGPILGVGFRF